MSELPFHPETAVEFAIVRDPAWVEGANHGVPRPGHPEGKVINHIAEVLTNVDRFYRDDPLRRRLRLISLIHDTFKHAVDPARAATGDNHHGSYARRFAERYTDDPAVLDVVELHDEAFNAWRAHVDGRTARAEERLDALLVRLGENLALYTAFYRCDNETGDKARDPLEWFFERTRKQ